MATDTKDPKIERINTLNKEIQELVDHLMDLPEARLTKNSSLTSNEAGLMNPKVIDLIKNAVLKAKRDTSTTKNIADIKAIVARIHHEAELEIRKIATEKPEKKEKKEEEGYHGPVKKPNPFEVNGNYSDIKKDEKNLTTVSAAVAASTERTSKSTSPFGVSTPSTKAINQSIPINQNIPKIPRQRTVTNIFRGGNTDPVKKSSYDKPLPQGSKSSPFNTKPDISLITKAAATPAGKTDQSINQIKPVTKKPKTKIILPPSKKDAVIPGLRKYIPPPLPLEDRVVEDFDPYSIEEFDRGQPGNPNDDNVLGNTRADFYEPGPQPEYPTSSPYEQDDSQDDDDSDNGEDRNRNDGRGPNSRRGRVPSRNFKSGFPKVPSNPLGGAATKKLAERGLIFFFTKTPVGPAILGGAIVLFLVVMFLLFIFNDKEEEKRANENAILETLTVEKVKILPPLLDAKVGDIVTFTITVKDTKPAQEVIVIDHLPDGISLLDADITSDWQVRLFNPTAKTITWKASENVTAPLLNPPNFTITIKYKVTKDKTHLVTWAEVNTIGAVGGISGTWVAPSNILCNGKDAAGALGNTIGKNFGNPQCNFSKDKLFALLKQADPANADVWFNKIVPCESGYNPNAYANPNTGTPDAAGAWGLYQMGSSSPPGLPPPAEGKNGINDRGDLNWEIQTENATTYGKKIGSLGRYWSCAR